MGYGDIRKLGASQIYEIIDMKQNIDIAYQKNLTRVGCTEEVLVEGESRKGKGQLTGRTPHNRIVNFYGDPQNRGVIMNVKIKKAHPYSLSGEIHG